jgi:hypothetical protein
MKKNILIAVIISSLFISFISCEDEKTINEENIVNAKLDIHNLKKDERLITYLNKNKIVLEKIKDIEKVRQLSQKEHLNHYELDILSESLGFENIEHYKNYYTSQTNLIKEINYDYYLAKYNSDELKKFIFGEDNNYQSKGPCEESCKRTHRNCLGATSAVAVAAHLGCASLDLAIIPGLICHGAALAAQAFTQDECNNQLGVCYRGCEDN